MSVCNMITFESLDVQSSFLVYGYLFKGSTNGRTTLSWRWRLWAPKILQIPLFRNPKGRRLLRVPQLGPQNPAYGGVLKSPRTLFRVCVRREFWRHHYLQAFSELTPGLLELEVTDVFKASVPFMAFQPFDSHTSSGGGPSSYGSSRGPFPQSCPRQERSWASIEKYTRL